MRNSDPFSDLIRSIEENLQREGDDWIPPDDQPPREPRTPQAGGGRRWLWILIPLLIFLFFNRILGFFTDYIWYDSLGFASVFTTRVYASFGLFVTAALVFWLFLAVNVWLARRMEPYGLVDTPLQQ
ncbi:MAG: UPF0182 family protein, partial [Caldilineaceae bacterium]|nr:UPF0182 family protein [Caldilineaceae bacterium]